MRCHFHFNVTTKKSTISILNFIHINEKLKKEFDVFYKIINEQSCFIMVDDFHCMIFNDGSFEIMSVSNNIKKLEKFISIFYSYLSNLGLKYSSIFFTSFENNNSGFELVIDFFNNWMKSHKFNIVNKTKENNKLSIYARQEKVLLNEMV